jgi:hopanoid biosynthesis associated protein HpnK
MPGCRLIVHADDFGQSELINEGVLLAHRNGILTSASIMPTGAAFEHAMRQCQANPSLDLGIHLTLIEEASLVDRQSIPSLINNKGRLHDHYTSFVRSYLLGKINLAEVRRELEAQVRKVLRYEIPISHLDSHQHIHMLPKIRAIVIELAKRYNIRAVRFPRETFEAYMLRERRSWPRLFQLAALNAVCAANRKEDILSTDHFVGFFLGGKLNVDNLKKVLRHLPRSGTCELMCHPGIEGADASCPHAEYDRSKELDALLSPDIAEIVRAEHIQLISYRDLPTKR